MSRRSLFVGIGSPHGDDRAGWEIAQRVRERFGRELEVRCARAPAELLDWLEGIDRLDVCDAVSDAQVGSFHCWRWPAAEIERVPFRGSHDLNLPAVLTLAGVLGCLPSEVRIWGLGIEPPGAFDGLSVRLAAGVPAAVERICDVLEQS